ncbi:MAG: hypothetical protein N0E59_11825 [Candidatus Thiodiazotropha taylori]|nr:hypothetical protein [Candidatus Thiodiazotropha taylori]MCG8111440.1 hypothetical protein [Candidatus Thiodiazotropha taylori]MCW4280123.1 hypothetical protein [Candidatus Thiodiazotropha taylori]MCW4283794.1 hypothetical protein [Candidatus Thiodiazotropha taylori]MCW4304373.1 hypothetical protein [Candidatus Thiodiazotropha taylori]
MRPMNQQVTADARIRELPGGGWIAKKGVAERSMPAGLKWRRLTRDGVDPQNIKSRLEANPATASERLVAGLFPISRK